MTFTDWSSRIKNHRSFSKIMAYEKVFVIQDHLTRRTSVVYNFVSGYVPLNSVCTQTQLPLRPETRTRPQSRQPMPSAHKAGGFLVPKTLTLPRVTLGTFYIDITTKRGPNGEIPKDPFSFYKDSARKMNTKVAPNHFIQADEMFGNKLHSLQIFIQPNHCLCIHFNR